MMALRPTNLHGPPLSTSPFFVSSPSRLSLCLLLTPQQLLHSIQQTLPPCYSPANPTRLERPLPDPPSLLYVWPTHSLCSRPAASLCHGQNAWRPNPSPSVLTYAYALPRHPPCIARRRCASLPPLSPLPLLCSYLHDAIEVGLVARLAVGSRHHHSRGGHGPLGRDLAPGRDELEQPVALQQATPRGGSRRHRGQGKPRAKYGQEEEGD